jgi:Tol biopolymer transport system component
MDFSPNGKYAAFVKCDTHQIRVFDSSLGQVKDIPTFGEGINCRLTWSSKEEILYLRTGTEDWEIVIAPVVAYRRLTSPPTEFADHYGRVGTTWSRDGVRYM